MFSEFGLEPTHWFVSLFSLVVRRPSQGVKQEVSLLARSTRQAQWGSGLLDYPGAARAQARPIGRYPDRPRPACCKRHGSDSAVHGFGEWLGARSCGEAEKQASQSGKVNSGCNMGISRHGKQGLSCSIGCPPHVPMLMFAPPGARLGRRSSACWAFVDPLPGAHKLFSPSGHALGCLFAICSCVACLPQTQAQ